MSEHDNDEDRTLLVEAFERDRGGINFARMTKTLTLRIGVELHLELPDHPDILDDPSVMSHFASKLHRLAADALLSQAVTVTDVENAIQRRKRLKPWESDRP